MDPDFLLLKVSILIVGYLSGSCLLVIGNIDDHFSGAFFSLFGFVFIYKISVKFFHIFYWQLDPEWKIMISLFVGYTVFFLIKKIIKKFIERAEKVMEIKHTIDLV